MEQIIVQKQTTCSSNTYNVRDTNTTMKV